MSRHFKLHYYKDPKGNFGDDINEWLWDRLAPGVFDESAETLFCGIGTLIDQTMPVASNWVIFTSGVGYGPRPPNFNSKGWTIGCVRGPLSAKVLGLDDRYAITDGAALLSLLPEGKPLPVDERRGTLFIPHHKAIDDSQLEASCRLAGIEYLSPREESKRVIERIRTARLVIADAMHGAIVADTLRVPWIPVQTSSEINTFKWLDWTASLGMPYNAIPLPASSAVQFWRNATLPLYKQNFALSLPTMENAIAHYEAHERLRIKPWWTTRRNLGHGFYKRLVAPSMKSTLLSPLRKRWDHVALEKTAAELNRIAKEPSFLSSDAKFYTARDRLVARFEEVTGATISLG
ncbi:succinoglycan biosynthesis protein ExoV [Rhizobium sp. BK650]|uniref:polysaccharide pyruvyl transferase family protein n=1 Tax=Rhizobium sp. BK650 TaxID=2586990 RepID=UPI00160E27C8|nr:polysaccharide pyruvyl transferase family protein [Rhizobium sp. BK650]MBB3659239.1 succinoglycan biosynthesis protein ExoV [Rhizobium sp. BK650]